MSHLKFRPGYRGRVAATAAMMMTRTHDATQQKKEQNANGNCRVPRDHDIVPKRMTVSFAFDGCHTHGCCNNNNNNNNA